MQCIVKQLFLAPLEHIDIEYEQRNLIELSVGKLKQEQLRHGVEPRLLRFVLINNALRALQCHMMRAEESPLTFTNQKLGDENTELFLCNTFKDGGLSLSPKSPPTPAKINKLGYSLSDQSPLVASTPFHDVNSNVSPCEDSQLCSTAGKFGKHVETSRKARDEGGGGEEGGGEENEKQTTSEFSLMKRVHLGKHASNDSGEENIPTAKRICSELTSGSSETSNGSVESIRPGTLSIKDKVVLNNINGINGLHNGMDIDLPANQSTPVSPTEPESDDESLTLSPIDFAKVDASLYDYDLSGQVPTANALLLPHTTTPPLLSAVSTQPLTTMTATATIQTTINSLSVLNSFQQSQKQQTSPNFPAIVISKAAQTDSVLTCTTSSPDSCDKTQLLGLQNSDTFSGTSCSMEGVVSTQNDLSSTNSLTRSTNSSSSKSCCGQLDGVPESDYFEDLVSLLIT